MGEVLTYCLNLLGKVCQNVIAKAVLSSGFVTVSFLFDTALSAELMALFILIILDFAFGIAHAYRNPNDYIKSKRAIKIVYKIVLYFGLVATARVTEQALPAFFLLQGIDETVIGFLAITELISVLEHASAFGLHIPKQILGQLKKKIK